MCLNIQKFGAAWRVRPTLSVAAHRQFWKSITIVEGLHVVANALNCPPLEWIYLHPPIPPPQTVRSSSYTVAAAEVCKDHCSPPPKWTHYGLILHSYVFTSPPPHHVPLEEILSSIVSRSFRVPLMQCNPVLYCFKGAVFFGFLWIHTLSKKTSFVHTVCWCIHV